MYFPIKEKIIVKNKLTLSVVIVSGVEETDASGTKYLSLKIYKSSYFILFKFNYFNPH